MTAGARVFRKVQIGKETTKGTAVAATARLLGSMTVNDTPTLYRPKEDRGSYAEFIRSFKIANMAELSFDSDVNFEQILYWLHMGVLGSVTPTGSGDAKTWTFTPGMSAAGTFNSFTLEHGDNIGCWEVEYCMARQIAISWAMNDVFKLKVDMFGRKVTSTSFTGSLSLPTVEPVKGQMAQLYIDDDGDTIGSTLVAATLISGNYTIKTGLSPARYGDGSLDFTQYAETEKNVELRMVLSMNSSTLAELALADCTTLRLVRVKAEGSLAESPSTNKALILDACGLWVPDSITRLGEREGEDVIEVTLSGQLGTTYTKVFEVTVINKVATLP